ncbi:MAG TPA: hypothetical protein DCQ92_07990 [Verrucomicrobia subdivision 3 bacterium]|nr:hypothetical protein [Limisphaerales bacterium]
MIGLDKVKNPAEGNFFRNVNFRFRRNFFWHTSCDTSCVARKNYHHQPVRNAAETAATNLRLATFQLSGLHIPSRVRKIPVLRRRLPITMIPQAVQPVMIRHTSQNLGSLLNEIRPVQSLPA